MKINWAKFIGFSNFFVGLFFWMIGILMGNTFFVSLAIVPMFIGYGVISDINKSEVQDGKA